MTQKSNIKLQREKYDNNNKNHIYLSSKFTYFIQYWLKYLSNFFNYIYKTCLKQYYQSKFNMYIRTKRRKNICTYTHKLQERHGESKKKSKKKRKEQVVKLPINFSNFNILLIFYSFSFCLWFILAKFAFDFVRNSFMERVCKI